MELKRIREIKNISQIELAKMIGISPQRLNNYEKGKRKIPPELWWKIFEALKLTKKQRLELVENIGEDDEN